MEIDVPATTTNFGAGFDTFGLALELYNVFEVKPADRYRVHILGNEGKNLPADESNLFIRVYKRACEVLGIREQSLELKQYNSVPVARGLGSSATAIVGGIECALALSGSELDVEAKLKIAFEFESHPDNLLPAFVGGFTVSAVGEERIYFVKHDFPQELKLLFVIPDFELSTEKARSVVKKRFSREEAVFNIQRASLFLSAILSGKYELIREAVRDKIHQPKRARLIKGFEEVLRAGYEAGALGVFLSGAGPTVCAIVHSNEEQVAESMVNAFMRAGVNASYKILRASREGCRVRY